MVLYVSPYVNHKIKYSKETIWLKLENTSIRIFVVIYMYIWNLIIPYCFKSSRKLIQHAVSTFQHYWKWRGGSGVTRRTEQSWESMRRRFAIYSIFLDIKKSIFYIKKSIPFLDIRTLFFDLKKSISWYQKFDSWYQEIGLIFFYIKKSDWFFYMIDFFHIKKWTFF